MSPNSAAIADVETATETAFRTLFAQTVPNVSVNVSEDLEELPIPRLDIVAEKTGEGPHEYLANGTWYYDQWSVRLTIRLVTSPDVENSETLRREVEEGIRNGFVPAQIDPFRVFFPLHEVADFRLAPAVRSILEDEKALATEWALDLMLFAKPSAW